MTFAVQETPIDPVESYLLNMRATTTLELHKLILRKFCEHLFDTDDFRHADWSQLSRANIQRFIHSKLNDIQFNTANNYITILQGFALECLNLQIISFDSYTQIRALKKFRGIPPEAGRALKLNEINKVKNTLSRSTKRIDTRNFAIFSLALGAGLRRAEISRLNIEDLDGNRLIVKGKGNKARTVYLSKFSLGAVKSWLNQFSRKKGALFTQVDRGDFISSERLGIRGIHHVINKIRNDSKLKHFTAHDLRRTFATTLLSLNNDIFTVQNLLGHSDPRTTQTYDKRGEKQKISAVNSLPF